MIYLWPIYKSNKNFLSLCDVLKKDIIHVGNAGKSICISIECTCEWWQIFRWGIISSSTLKLSKQHYHNETLKTAQTTENKINKTFRLNNSNSTLINNNFNNKYAFQKIYQSNTLYDHEWISLNPICAAFYYEKETPKWVLFWQIYFNFKKDTLRMWIWQHTWSVLIISMSGRPCVVVQLQKIDFML